MPTHRTLRAPLLALALGFGAATAQAQAIVSTGESFVTARLMLGEPQSDGSRFAGLRLSLADGWKTYWRSPGEAGVPPVFDWSRSRNLHAAEIFWPRPELFESFGLRAVGYSHQVVLPIRLVPEDPDQPMEVSLQANLGVCRELCVIEQIEISEVITPDEAPIGAGQIARALDAVPAAGAESGLSAAECRITGSGAERRLEATLRFARPLIAPVVLVEGPDTVWITAPVTRREGDALHVSADLSLLDRGAWIDRSAVRLTVLDDAFAADIRGCASPRG